MTPMTFANLIPRPVWPGDLVCVQYPRTRWQLITMRPAPFIFYTVRDPASAVMDGSRSYFAWQQILTPAARIVVRRPKASTPAVAINIARHMDNLIAHSITEKASYWQAFIEHANLSHLKCPTSLVEDTELFQTVLDLIID